MKTNSSSDDNELVKIRHTAEHVLMQAMDELFPGKIIKAMGPTTDQGFYFDFEATDDFKISELDFKAIEKKMQIIIDHNLPLVRQEMSPKKANEIFKDNPYKLEWIKEAQGRGDTLTIFYTGDPKNKDSFVDLCSGPHAKSTGQIKAYKLLSIAGAYWRGDEKNKMLTRVYGTAFSNSKDLRVHLNNIEEAKKRDHKILGPQLELFMFHNTSPGCPYWLPKGMVILNELMDFWRKEHKTKGYQETSTPLINKKELWETSGHWEHYQEDMFIAKMGENEIYGIKPMNCPNAMVIFDSKTRSYKDLPLRLSDSDTLHRYERSGVLNGLLRVRSFKQDDSHNFITEDQIKDEYQEIMNIAELFYGIFNLDFSYRLGTRPKKYLGDKKVWDKAEAELKKILDQSGRRYTIENEDGAFYGPKIDIVMKDTLNRDWQMGTIQLDFQIPQRFKLKYTDSDGKEKTPVVVHRVIYGSIERFIGILIEHFAGAFPVWLSPVQVAILPISEKFLSKAEEIKSNLADQGIRVELDVSNESLGKKIRNAESQKTPYMIILGQKEIDQDLVSVRQRGEKDLGQMTLASFSAKINKEIKEKLIF
jgi:threonyl-tRNA synthetase